MQGEIFAAVLFAAPVVNDQASKKTADGLAGLPLPTHTELVETTHRSGKPVGNGNGMQKRTNFIARAQLVFSPK